LASSSLRAGVAVRVKGADEMTLSISVVHDIDFHRFRNPAQRVPAPGPEF
jgi:hypothetical protein